MEERDSKNVELLRKHVTQMMGGNKALRETMELWEDPKRNEGDPEEEMQVLDA